ncbi:uncharacterized protein Dwil_GK27609 [Drosophila willistoni]|uniref:Uncharacterized protein n=1 Tax=Drosophila willistoni TaxID=7260 RepID=A0A0Q9X1N2_DROWI|nr:uncharacterized protein Dwil_GK27609 [Drosophila willistoni]
MEHFPNSKNILPRCVLHVNAEGQIEVKGFITRIVKNFVEKLNGSLDITLNLIVFVLEFLYHKWTKQ